ncbi:uncharacterized protein FA14DRAFT_52984 [Meira miltonrushii]|uniref:Uncharacterized protein n=1 Tax=Meira miltonrushii TaxID=1280837 RepID=A0A316VF63_9BASI|nr:uncharacterized protein FA14DRAFT_52984 [Meira miltonrushii]PWN36222.1 hypothetical protein FA14DRAFT_52984 [Meira miltonrushii]
MYTQIDQGGPSTKGDGMEHVVDAYLESPPSTRQSNTSCDTASDPILALFSITPHQFAVIGNVRIKKLARAVLADLASEECKWPTSVRVAAWKTMKEFSRIPASSLALSDEAQVQRLIRVLISFRDRLHSANETSTSKDDSEVEQLDLALRVLNNVLFQQAESRQIFAKSIDGIRCCLDLLENPGTPMIVFLSARLIFYATLSPSNTLREAVQSTQLVEVFTIRLSALLQQPQSSEVEMAEAEILKAFFNVGLHLPRMTETKNGNQAGEEHFDEVLLPFLAPTVRLLADVRRRNGTPELRSPYTNAIAVLLNFPVYPYEETWRTGLLLVAVDDTQHTEMNGKMAKLRSSSGGGSESDRSSTTSAMSRSRKAASAFFRSPFNRQSSQKNVHLPNSESPLLKTLLDMVDTFCKKHFSGKDIDDHHATRNEEEDLQAIGEPALLLLRKLANGSEKFRLIAKSRILPESIDRKIGLDKREDLTGILIRLMGSQNYPRLARASGEALLAICGGRASQMTAEIGYGPCAGFLTNIGQAHAVPESEMKDSSGRPIDPITGKVLPTTEEMVRQDAESGFSQMTEEEKEAEAERLFGLFDRLDKTGIIKVDKSSNPMQKAVDSGRFQEIDEEEDEKKLEEANKEDEELEASVEREMRSYREKQNRTVA